MSKRVHQDIVKRASQAVQKRNDRAGGSKRAKTERLAEEWEADHLEIFKHEGLPWPPNIEADAELAAAVAHLTRRHQECAYFHTHRRREGAAESGPATQRFHDLNESLSRYSESIGLVQTLVCSSVIYSSHDKMVHSGVELMALQGYPPGITQLIDHPEKTESNGHLTEMAGNSYNGFPICPIVAAVLAHWRCLDFEAATVGSAGADGESGHESAAVGEEGMVVIEEDVESELPVSPSPDRDSDAGAWC